MDLELTTVARALEAGGAYGLISVLVVGLVRLYRDLKAVNEQVVRLTEQQTAVMVRVEGALMALRDAILCMSGQPPRRPATRIADFDDTHDAT
jgi:hypothetical protein